MHTHMHACMGPHLSHTLQPCVEGVAGHPEVGLAELVLLGPAEGSVAEPLLDDGVQPGHEEVQPGSLMGLLEKKLKKLKNFF